MPESITEPVFPVQPSYAAVLSDLEADDMTLRNIRRPNIAPTGIRFDASHTSLDLWYVGLDVTADISSFRHWLSDGELVRAERFHFGLHRARYIVGRAALRFVLANRLGCSPAAVRFSYGRNGKPMLESGQGNIEFNLAHSGGDAVIAVAGGVAIGVDIELLRPMRISSYLHSWCSRMPSFASLNSPPIPCRRSAMVGRGRKHT